MTELLCFTFLGCNGIMIASKRLLWGLKWLTHVRAFSQSQALGKHSVKLGSHCLVTTTTAYLPLADHLQLLCIFTFLESWSPQLFCAFESTLHNLKYFAFHRLKCVFSTKVAFILPGSILDFLIIEPETNWPLRQTPGDSVEWKLWRHLRVSKISSSQ